MSLKKITLHWLPVVLYSVFIFNLSSRSDVGVQHDKIAHTCAYGLLSLLYLWALRLHIKSLPLLLAAAVTLTIIYGASDEYHQSFVPGRNASMDDVMADAIGAILGGLFYALITRFSKGKSAA